MCSTTHLLQSMENYQGDLADIFRASSGNASSITGDHHHHHLPGVRSPSVHHAAPDWPDQMFHHHHQHPCSSSDHPILSYPPEGMESPPPPLNFGHPFNNLRDPLLEDLDMPPNPAAGFFISASAATATAATTNDAAVAGAAFGQKNNIVVDDDNDIIKSGSQPHSNIINHNHNHNRNIFSRMLQISPNNATTTSTTKLPLSPPPPCDHRGILKAPTPSSSPSLILTNDMINANTSSKGCLVENNALQISSPRNTGIKRRKSQAKKVVCIPAPAPANSRPTGEVVPSDLWAWRKYGQKPIKGSPYPRGYYRCSSSKGCSARKQVERSRTDPNMLVITYTSEHNHPWPTQRNALAGSTRNQPSKTHNNSNNSSKSPPPPPPAATPGGSDQGSQKGRPITSLKEEPKDPVTSTHDSTSTVFGSSMAVDHHHVDALMVKEESMEELDKEGLDHMDDHEDGEDDQIFNGGGGGGGHDQGFPALQSYRPVLPDITANHQQLMLQQHHHLAADQDFFADLGEIEADPLNLLFTHGFSGDDIEDQREDDHSKSLDPFSFYDWAAAGNHINSSSTATTPSSYGDAKWPEGL